MRTFVIYFTIFGKKLKATVEASSKSQAIEIVKSKLQIVKVVEKDQIIDELKNIFAGF